MSGTDCHACVSSIGRLSSPLGNTNEPLGVCKNCSSLACGHHAHRDPNVPEYICVECDPKLLQATAAAMAGSGQSTHPILHQMRLGYYRFFQDDDSLPFISLEDFEGRRPGYRRDLFKQAREIHFPWERLPPDLYSAVQWIPEEGRLLLITALLITVQLEFPKENVDAVMKTMRSVYFDRNSYE